MSRIGKAVKLYSYARASQSRSEYASKMNRLSNQIFGELHRPTSRISLQVIDRLSKQPMEETQYYNQYFPAIEETTELFNTLREYGLFRDEYADFKEEMEKLRTARGKNKVRAKWKDGVKPVKKLELRYDEAKPNRSFKYHHDKNYAQDIKATMKYCRWYDPRKLPKELQPDHVKNK